MALCSSFLNTLAPLKRRFATLLELMNLSLSDPQKVDRAFFDFMLLNKECLYDPTQWVGGVVVPNKVHLSFDVSLPFKTTQNEVLKETMMSEFITLSKLLLTDQNLAAVEQESRVVSLVREKMLVEFQMQELYDIHPPFAYIFDAIFTVLDETDINNCNTVFSSPVLAQAMTRLGPNVSESLWTIMPSILSEFQDADKVGFKRLGHKIGVLLQNVEFSSSVRQFLTQFQNSHPEITEAFQGIIPGDIDLGALFAANLPVIIQNLTN